MKKIDIAPVEAAIEVIREFNRLDLADVDLYRGDEKLPVDRKTLDGWKFIGLSNKDFLDASLGNIGIMTMVGSRE